MNNKKSTHFYRTSALLLTAALALAPACRILAEEEIIYIEEDPIVLPEDPVMPEPIVEEPAPEDPSAGGIWYGYDPWYDPWYDEGGYEEYEGGEEYERPSVYGFFEEEFPEGLYDDSQYEDDSDAYDLLESYEIKDFPHILQLPELPTGCEITALTMMLRYYGYDIDKETMASQYLPTVSIDSAYYDEEGNGYGPDLYHYFVGDPFDIGLVCGPGAIATAARSFLLEYEAGFEAFLEALYADSGEEPYAQDYAPEDGVFLVPEDITGASPERLYAYIQNDIPVLVWITINMEPRQDPEGWYTEDGNFVDWTTNDHGAVLIGFNDRTVTVADPMEGIIHYSRSDFESVYRSRGRKSFALEDFPYEALKEPSEETITEADGDTSSWTEDLTETYETAAEAEEPAAEDVPENSHEGSKKRKKPGNN